MTPREIELKLECEALDLPRLRNHPLLAAGGQPAPEPALLEATYFDTAERALRTAGLSLRVRRDGARYVQTLKIASASVGLFDRPEWEWPVDGPEPRCDLLDDTPAARVLAEDGGAPVPVFRTVIQRAERPVRYGASDIVVTLDAGRVETDRGDASVCEVELELKRGTAADLFGLAASLGESVPLRLGALSKGERGDALLDGTLRKPRKAEMHTLAPEATVGEAFTRIAQGCLRHYGINEAVFLHNRDHEALHQMRVALRRLRSAFSLFRPMLETDAQAEALRQALKDATAPFGAARNLDVFLGETLADQSERRPDEPAIGALRDHLEAERDRAYATVIEVLDGPAWRALLLHLVAFVETGAWRENDALTVRDRPARDFAAEELERLRRRLKKRGADLAALAPEARHRVRIVAKKLRYGSEFFGSLFAEKKAGKRHRAFTTALSDFQDQLGALNDIATARTIADGLIEPRSGAAPGAAMFAAGLAAGDGEARAAALVDAACEAYDDLLEVRRFWR